MDAFEELIGKSYKEYAQYLSELKDILLEELAQLKEAGMLSNSEYERIIKRGSMHIIKHFPNLLPPTNK